MESGGASETNEAAAWGALRWSSGGFVGKATTGRLEEIIARVYLGAIKESVRQVRMRDLGGIIVLDLIDMGDKKNRQKVYQAVEQELRRAEGHRRMSVVPARVHHARDLGREWDARLLVDRKGVHVRP